MDQWIGLAGWMVAVASLLMLGLAHARYRRRTANRERVIQALLADHARRPHAEIPTAEPLRRQAKIVSLAAYRAQASKAPRASRHH